MWDLESSGCGHIIIGHDQEVVEKQREGVSTPCLVSFA